MKTSNKTDADADRCEHCREHEHDTVEYRSQTERRVVTLCQPCAALLFEGADS